MVGARMIHPDAVRAALEQWHRWGGETVDPERAMRYSVRAAMDWQEAYEAAWREDERRLRARTALEDVK